MMIEQMQEKAAPLLRAENILNLQSYEGLDKVRALPLVASIDHVVDSYSIEDPRILEVGVVPTFYSSSKISESDIPPSWHLAERHPDWHIAAVSPHEITPEEKKALLPGREDLFITETGPDRHGLYPNDVFDESYIRGGDIFSTKYPLLFQKLGDKAPDIVFARHTFDSMAKKYPVEKLTTVAAMILPPGGFLVSHVFGSDSKRPFLALQGNMFPFDDKKSMTHVSTLEFGEKDGKPQYVYIYQKKGDVIRANHPLNRQQ
jgi:hypothetical protein